MREAAKQLSKICGPLKKIFIPRTPGGFYPLLSKKLNHKKLLERIKKHEGFSNVIYNDKLGNPTIGYGHLIKPKDNFNKNKKYTKKQLTQLFEADFLNAKKQYDKHFLNKKLPTNVKEVLIEMIFQLGIQNVLKFRKMISSIKKNDYVKASEEMVKSKWYLQTPNRVKILAKIMKKNNV